MRNLKRALSLGLASSMVLGTMAFGVSASQIEKFADADQITLEKQVGVVNQIGLMLGDDEGNFNPSEAVTRAEMAVICTTMLNGAGFHASQFVGTAVFNDVPEWCQDYVNLAASLGIVAGRGDGVFAPNDTVTTAEAMLMILKTLGYYDKDDSRLNDELMSNWSLSATRQGTSLNLYDTSVDGDLAADQPLNRENVASICFRALTDVVQVDYNPSTSAYYNYGGNMQYGVDNSSTEYTLGYKYFLKLHAADDVDVFNRPAVSWMYDGQEIDNYVQDATFTTTEAITGKDMYSTIGSAILNNEAYDRGIYVNGELLTNGYVMDAFDEDSTHIDGRKLLDVDTTTMEGFNSLLSNSDTTTWLETGNGVLTEVFIIDPVYVTDNNGNRTLVKSGEIVISMVHTYLATVTDLDDLGDGLYKYYVDIPQKDASEVLEQYGEIRNEAKMRYFIESSDILLREDVVSVQIAESADTSTYNVVSIEKLEAVNGIATGSNGSPGSVGGRWLAVDGETYDYSYTSCGNMDDKIVMVPTNDDDIKVYLDQYGYTLGYEADVPATKYLYVEDRGAFNLSSGMLRVTLNDGVEYDITVSQVDGVAVNSTSWASFPESTRDTAKRENYTADENGKNTDQLANRIYGYVELSDGTYNLTTMIQEQATPVPVELENSDDYLVYDKGVLGGIDVEDSEFTLKGLHNNLGKGLVHAPSKDTMFIYDSVSNEGGYNFKISNKLAGVRETAKDGTDFVFMTDENTLFVDVVNNKQYVGFSAVPTIDEDLNMQVVFGDGGYADYVFINNGLGENLGNYVIFQDNNFTYSYDGTTKYYSYNVWDLNTASEKTIVSKDEEMFAKIDARDILGSTDIANNDLYRITNFEEDGDMIIVKSLEHYYSLDQFADNQYGALGMEQVPMGAASTVGESAIIMDRKERYDSNNSSDTTSGKNYIQTETSWIYDQAVNAAGDAITDTYNKYDTFTITSSTKVIKLVANNADAESEEKFTISVGTLDDIKTVDQKGTTWVDVVSASRDGSASVVLVVKPYGYDDVASGSQKLSDCEVDVWRRNNDSDEVNDGFINGTGLSENDPARLAGTIDLENFLVNGELPTGIETMDLVYRIAAQYAYDLKYDPASVVLSTVAKGTNWEIYDEKEVGEWIIKIAGNKELSTGGYETIDHYVSLYFGEPLNEYNVDEDRNDLKKVHVISKREVVAPEETGLAAEVKKFNGKEFACEDFDTEYTMRELFAIIDAELTAQGVDLESYGYSLKSNDFVEIPSDGEGGESTYKLVDGAAITIEMYDRENPEVRVEGTFSFVSTTQELVDAQELVEAADIVVDDVTDADEIKAEIEKIVGDDVTVEVVVAENGNVTVTLTDVATGLTSTFPIEVSETPVGGDLGDKDYIGFEFADETIAADGASGADATTNVIQLDLDDVTLTDEERNAYTSDSVLAEALVTRYFYETYGILPDESQIVVGIGTNYTVKTVSDGEILYFAIEKNLIGDLAVVMTDATAEENAAEAASVLNALEGANIVEGALANVSADVLTTKEYAGSSVGSDDETQIIAFAGDFVYSTDEFTTATKAEAYLAKSVAPQLYREFALSLGAIEVDEDGNDKDVAPSTFVKDEGKGYAILTHEGTIYKLLLGEDFVVVDVEDNIDPDFSVEELDTAAVKDPSENYDSIETMTFSGMTVAEDDDGIAISADLEITANENLDTETMLDSSFEAFARGAVSNADLVSVGTPQKVDSVTKSTATSYMAVAIYVNVDGVAFEVTLTLSIALNKSYEITLEYANDETASEVKGTDKNGNVTLPVPTRNTYHFVEWQDASNRVVTSLTKFEEPTTLTAQWRINVDSAVKLLEGVTEIGVTTLDVTAMAAELAGLEEYVVNGDTMSFYVDETTTREITGSLSDGQKVFVRFTRKGELGEHETDFVEIKFVRYTPED